MKIQQSLTQLPFGLYPHFLEAKKIVCINTFQNVQNFNNSFSCRPFVEEIFKIGNISPRSPPPTYLPVAQLASCPGRPGWSAVLAARPACQETVWADPGGGAFLFFGTIFLSGMFSPRVQAPPPWCNGPYR